MKNQGSTTKIISLTLFISFFISHDIISQEDWPCNQPLHGIHNVHIDCNEDILITSLAEDGETGTVIKGIITTSTTIRIIPGHKFVRIIPVSGSGLDGPKTHTTRLGNGGNVGGSIGKSKKESFSNQFILYPNPAKDVINITLIKTKMTGYRLFDLYGNTIKQEQIKPVLQHLLSVQKIKKGMYMIKIQLETGTFLTEQIFKN